MPIINEQPGTGEDQPSVVFYSDSEGHPLPVYDSPSYQENLERYKAWCELLSEQSFEYAIGDIDKGSIVSVKELILEFPYHPNFAEVFFSYLVNRLEDCQPLHPDGMENFLDSMYGAILERPDCDHLLAAIRKHGRYPVQAPENIQRAVQWLEAKQRELPIWPPQYGEPDENGRIKRLHAVNLATLNAGQSPKENEARVTPDEQTLPNPECKAISQGTDVNPFGKALHGQLTFHKLKKLLYSIELIDEDETETVKASAGAWAWVICALKEKMLIRGNRNAPYITQSLRNCFGANVKKRMIQYALKGKAELSENDDKEFYNEAIAYIEAGYD